MSENTEDFWEGNAHESIELLPREYEMTLGFDYVFTEDGRPLIVEINGKRSGLGGVKDIPNDSLETSYEKTKKIVDTIRGDYDSGRLNRDLYEAGLGKGAFTDEEHGELSAEYVQESLAVTLKMLFANAFNQYPNDIPEEDARTIMTYGRIFVEHHRLIYEQIDKQFVHAVDMPELIDFIVSDKLFLQMFVPHQMRPQEFQEMTDEQKEQAEGWVLKYQRGIQGSSVKILENTPQNREAMNETLTSARALTHSVQEYIPAASAEADQQERPASLRYLQDVRVNGEDFEVTYGGGYQRVGVSEGKDERIVNRSQGAKSVKMTRNEFEKISPSVEHTTQEIVEVIAWLRRNLEAAL